MIDKRKNSEQFICSVLGIGYPPREQNSEKTTWLANGIEFDFADTVDQSIEKTEQKNYCCIVICSDWIHQNDLTVLRQICSVPIVIMPSEYSLSQRQQYAVWSALQYIHVAELSRCQDLDKYSMYSFRSAYSE